MAKTDAQAKQTLRPRGEVRQLLLDAARKLFAERGYAGTPTRAISEEAGVVHSLLHFHFPSKAKLFEEAVFDPIGARVERLMQASEEREQANVSATMEDECRYLVEELYDVLTENRLLILALVAVDVNDDKSKMFTDDEHKTLFDTLLERLEAVADDQFRARGLNPSVRIDLVVRLTFGTVMAATVMDRWVLRVPLPREEVVNSIVTMMLKGVADQPSTVGETRKRK